MAAVDAAVATDRPRTGRDRQDRDPWSTGTMLRSTTATAAPPATSTPIETTDRWAARFDERADRHAEVQTVAHGSLDPVTSELLGRSLAIFQLGESGTGEHLFEAARRADTDRAYQRSLHRFVAEEQEHARLLGLALEALGHPRRTAHWTDRVFVIFRRAHLLRMEVLVLMVAEVIALSYYRALADGVPATDLADIFDRIHRDEVVHVAFHGDTLPDQLRRFPRPVHALSRLAWSGLVVGAALAVIKDHGRLLSRVGLPRRRFLAQVLSDRRRVAAQLFRREP